MKKVKLYVAVPSCRDWKVQFGSSLLGLLFHLTMRLSSGYEVESLHFNTMAGVSLLPRGREKALEDAILMGFTHILFLDDDMSFPQDVFDRLLAHDLPIVCTNYRAKVPGVSRSGCTDFENNYINSNDHSGVSEVNVTGFGVILLSLDAMKDFPAPHFSVLWDEELGDYWGEDVFFCKRARDHGLKIMCDHDLSKDIAHIGDYPYSFDVEPYRHVQNARVI